MTTRKLTLNLQVVAYGHASDKDLADAIQKTLASWATFKTVQAQPTLLSFHIDGTDVLVDGKWKAEETTADCAPA